MVTLDLNKQIKAVFVAMLNFELNSLTLTRQQWPFMLSTSRH